MHAYIVTEI